MTDLNPQLISQRSAALEQAIADLMTLVEQSRAGRSESEKVLEVLKQGAQRAERWLSLLKLNERLNRLRERARDGSDSSDPEISRSQMLNLAVNAGLPLARAAQLIDQARADGKSLMQRQSGEQPLDGPQVDPR